MAKFVPHRIPTKNSEDLTPRFSVSTQCAFKPVKAQLTKFTALERKVNGSLPIK
jgi:hypothetical protein